MIMKPKAAEPVFAYRQVREILARLHGVHDSKMKTFEFRLQQLQRLKLPPGTNVGQSGRAKYRYWQLAELDVYLNMLDAGATPALLAANFAERPLYLQGHGQEVERASSGEDRLIAIRFHTLAPLESADPAHVAPTALDREDWFGHGPQFFAGLSNGPAPIVINLTRRVAALKAVVGELWPDLANEMVFPGPAGSLSYGPN